MSHATFCCSAHGTSCDGHPSHAVSDAAGEELFLSYGTSFWVIQNDSFRAIKREKQREMELEQVCGRFALPGRATAWIKWDCLPGLPFMNRISDCCSEHRIAFHVWLARCLLESGSVCLLLRVGLPCASFAYFLVQNGCMLCRSSGLLGPSPQTRREVLSCTR